MEKIKFLGSEAKRKRLLRKRKCNCGVYEGHLHKNGCNREVCPKCNCISWTSCKCYKDVSKLEDNERIRFFIKPNLCARCGQKFPRMFIISKKDWQKNVSKNFWKTILCLRCYKDMSSKIKKAKEFEKRAKRR